MRIRSVTILCMYLMARCHIPMEIALLLVRAVRPIAEPNPGFALLLRKYEKQLFALE